jgi:hypothetical protein
MMQEDQLLKIFTALIDIPSIMIDLPHEADKTINIFTNLLERQLHRKECAQFFRIIDGFNYSNFDIIQWLNWDIKILFEIDNEIYEPGVREGWSEWILTTENLTQVYIDVIARMR